MSLLIGFAEPQPGGVHGLAAINAGALLLGSAGAVTPAVGAVELTESDASAGRWRVRCGGAFDLTLSSLAAQTAAEDRSQAQQVRVEGTVHHGPDERALADGTLGEIMDSGGLWAGVALRRVITVRFGTDLAYTLLAEHPLEARGHGEEPTTAWMHSGDPALSEPIFDALLSTTWGPDARITRAGLELWASEDAPGAIRIAGTACGHGRLVTGSGAEDVTIDTTFFNWRHRGRIGTGRYDLLAPIGSAQLSLPSLSQT